MGAALTCPIACGRVHRQAPFTTRNSLQPDVEYTFRACLALRTAHVSVLTAHVEESGTVFLGLARLFPR